MRRFRHKKTNIICKETGYKNPDLSYLMENLLFEKEDYIYFPKIIIENSDDWEEIANINEYDLLKTSINKILLELDDIKVQLVEIRLDINKYK